MYHRVHIASNHLFDLIEDRTGYRVGIAASNGWFLEQVWTLSLLLFHAP